MKKIILLFCITFCMACKNNTATTTAATEAQKNMLTTASWHCSGTEPFWSVEIENGMATIETPEKKEAPIVLTSMTQTSTKHEFSGQVATYSGENLKIRIKKEQCSDGMSETVYLYAAEVDFDIYEFKGCANKK